MIGWIALGVGIFVGLVVLMALYYYNRFITLENRIDNSSSQIDVQLRKRAELVPNLVKVVKGYAKHEKGIMEDISAKARSPIDLFGDQLTPINGKETKQTK